MGTTATVTATSGGLGILKPGLSAQTTGIVSTSSSLSGLKLANTTLTPSVSTTQLGGLGLGGGGLKPGLGTGMSQGGLTLQGGRGATGLTTMAQSTAVTSSSASGFRGLGGVDPSASAGNNGGIGG